MLNIVLLCAYGASTGMLCDKIIDAAKNMNIDCSVNAYSYDDADKVVPLADIVLLGPQMRMKLRECQAKFGNQGIPFMVIDIKDYGRMNGANVLKAALAELEGVYEKERIF